MSLVPEFDALTLDVGGVFVVPEHDRLDAALRASDIAIDRSRFWDGHYLAMHAVDADQSPAETFSTYVPAFCHHLGLRGEEFQRAIAALEPLFGPSGLWVEPIPGSVDGLRRLHDAGIPLAIVSNADGTVHQVLDRAGICQVGDGPLVPVVQITDSGAIGVAKPDPATFAPALEALGTDPARTLHVGDSVHYDVLGAIGAGMAAVHFDPRQLCRSDEHPHVAALTDLLPA
ncbi:MAG: HAD family hydrolase [Acidimicrobiales bacterium]